MAKISCSLNTASSGFSIISTLAHWQISTIIQHPVSGILYPFPHTQTNYSPLAR